MSEHTEGGDPYDLERFVQAQARNYEQALAEIRRGRKQSHWMWYVFPQLAGLGTSSTAQRYALANLDEAAAYLHHPLLGPRLLECASALLRVEGRSANEIFGWPDELKLRSSLTLFALVSPAQSVFDRVLDAYFNGEHDAKTLQLLGLPARGR
jgi:uncharacterized protein (DUF1810 family)